MKDHLRQLLAAFLMGVMMPALFLRIGQLFVPPQEPPRQPTITPDAVVEQRVATVPVLLSENQLSIMALESYVCGVVLAEMPVDFSSEALKAQAVAARTCALYCVEQGAKHAGGAVCTDSGCCQAYMPETQYMLDGGTAEAVQKVRDAVYETAGQVLTYKGALIDSAYFSCSGGMTEDAVAVWGSDVPYLQSVRSPGEEWAQIYSQTLYFTAEQFQTALGRKLAGQPKDWLGALERTRGGGVATMILAGVTYTGTQLRRLFGLNSTAFTMESEGEGIRIHVTGRGHRVGMSQYGAQTMALAGSSYEEILAYYYQGVIIDKPDALE